MTDVYGSHVLGEKRHERSRARIKMPDVHFVMAGKVRAMAGKEHVIREDARYGLAPLT